jgi:RNA polymerase sigma-70 factor (ECF subfamily)
VIEVLHPGTIIADQTKSSFSLGSPLAAPDLTTEFQARVSELASLVERIAAGDQDALTSLYDTTHRQVYGLLLRILGDAHAAEEVLLDVYVQVWRQAAHYERGRGKPQAWLVTIARSRAIDRLRSRKQLVQREKPLEEARAATAAVSAEETAARSEMRSLVCSALNTLPAEQREVIELAFYSGFSQSEIAARLGQPLGTVKTRTRRGMMKLRDILRPALEG